MRHHDQRSAIRGALEFYRRPVRRRIAGAARFCVVIEEYRKPGRDRDQPADAECPGCQNIFGPFLQRLGP